MRKKQKKRDKKKKTLKILTIVLLIYVIFFLYNNINLGPKRTYIFYESLNVKENTIEYNDYIVEKAKPIFIDKGDNAVLLLHGMGGSPFEMSEMAEFLADKNITVFIPLMKSHGRTYKDMGGMDAEELYEESLEYVNILKQNYDEVYVGGLSTGGSLALKLAENEDLEGVIPLAAPITYGADFLKGSTIYFFRVMKVLTPSLRRIIYGLARDPIVHETLPSFDRLPVRILIEGELLKKEVMNNLDKIEEPILILQSRFDNRAAPSSAQYIYDNVNSEDKTLLYLNNSGHVITMDYDKELVFEEIYDFILR